MHKSSVGELIDVEVGHFAVVLHLKAYPVLAFTASDDGKLLLGDAILKYYGRYAFHSVGNARQVE